MKLLQQLASDLQKACSDAESGRLEVLFGRDDRLTHLCQELLHSRQPQEVMAAELDILVALLESASLRAKRWAELTQRLQEYCAIWRAMRPKIFASLNKSFGQADAQR